MSSQTKEDADIGANSNIKCPKCGSPNYIPIVYGKPTYEAYEKGKCGELILAGCFLPGPNPPNKRCKNCQHSYR